MRNCLITIYDLPLKKKCLHARGKCIFNMEKINFTLFDKKIKFHKCDKQTICFFFVRNVIITNNKKKIGTHKSFIKSINL